MTLLFTTIGSLADYDNWNKWVLIVATGECTEHQTRCEEPPRIVLTLAVICWGSQFGFLGVTLSSQWQTAMALFMVGYITYGVTLVFYASVFPRLARNTARTKEARDQFARGEIALEDYERVEMLEKNRISNISTAHSNCKSSVHGIHRHELSF
jgi:uncharacterized membrane protein